MTWRGQAPLDPVVLDGEAAHYVPGVSAEAQMMYNLHNPMARMKAAGGAAGMPQPHLPRVTETIVR
jgi:hypothetical protein